MFMVYIVYATDLGKHLTLRPSLSKIKLIYRHSAHSATVVNELINIK